MLLGHYIRTLPPLQLLVCMLLLRRSLALVLLSSLFLPPPPVRSLPSHSHLLVVFIALFQTATSPKRELRYTAYAPPTRSAPFFSPLPSSTTSTSTTSPTSETSERYNILFQMNEGRKRRVVVSEQNDKRFHFCFCSAAISAAPGGVRPRWGPHGYNAPIRVNQFTSTTASPSSPRPSQTIPAASPPHTPSTSTTTPTKATAKSPISSPPFVGTQLLVIVCAIDDTVHFFSPFQILRESD